jgi:hypothetical protein
MNAIAFTREVRAVFGEPRRMDATRGLAAILRDARRSALLGMRVALFLMVRGAATSRVSNHEAVAV